MSFLFDYGSKKISLRLETIHCYLVHDLRLLIHLQMQYGLAKIPTKIIKSPAPAGAATPPCGPGGSPQRLSIGLRLVESRHTPQFRAGNPYFFSENLYQSVSFIYASMYREHVHAMGVAMDTEPYPVVAGLLIRKAVTW